MSDDDTLDLKVIGNAIQRIRNLRGINQEQLADQIDHARSWVSRVESGSADPKLSSIQEVVRTLGVDMVGLFEIARQMERSGEDDGLVDTLLKVAKRAEGVSLTAS